MQSFLDLSFIRDRAMWLAMAALALTGLAACDDDEKTDAADAGRDAEVVDSGRDGEVADAGSDGQRADAGSEADPLFVVHSAAENASGTRINYFSLSSSLGKKTKLDYADSIEVPGRARLYAQPGLGYLVIGDSENVSLTRYTITEDDEVEEGRSLSFQQLGVQSMGARAVYFVSETKAYYKDSDQAQIIVWNPKKMTIEGTLELPEEVFMEGSRLSLGEWAARGDGHAYFTVGWTGEDYDRVLPGTKLVRIDTDSDEITVTDDDRCRGLSLTAHHDGVLYFFSSVINGFGQVLYPDDGGQPSCVLRINDGETTFDSDYVGDVAGAFTDDQSPVMIDVTEDGTGWAQVADLDVAPSEVGATYSEWYAEGWSWYKLPLDSLDGPQSVSDDAGAYSGFTATAGSSFFIAQSEADYSKTTLVDLSGDAPKPGLSFVGFALGVAQVR